MDRKKLLITGLPGVGKTTLVRKLAARLGPLRPVGFFTEEVREGGVRKGFEWVGFDGRRGTLAHVRFSSRYRVGKYRVNVDGFERFLEGVPFLAPDTKLVVIDEIGKMECFSPTFRELIEKLMSSDKTLIATAAAKGGGLIGEVKRRPDVELIEVTARNRDDLVDDLAARAAAGN